MLFKAIAIWATIASMVGMLAPIWLWQRFPLHRRRTQRLVDLASYFIAAAGLGTYLFSVARIDATWEDVIKQMPITSTELDLGFDELVKLDEICPTNRHTPFQMRREKRIDCERMRDYFLRQPGRVPGTLTLHPYPSTDKFQDPIVREFAREILQKAYKVNVATLNYAAGRPRFPSEVEATFYKFAFPILALAIGLGIARRVLDVAQDWTAPSR